MRRQRISDQAITAFQRNMTASRGSLSNWPKSFHSSRNHLVVDKTRIVSNPLEWTSLTLSMRSQVEPWWPKMVNQSRTLSDLIRTEASLATIKEEMVTAATAARWTLVAEQGAPSDRRCRICSGPLLVNRNKWHQWTHCQWAPAVAQMALERLL